jgi:hypothetical protein
VNAFSKLFVCSNRQFADQKLSTKLVLLGTPPSGDKCFDYGSNVTARSFAFNVDPLSVFEAWCLLRAKFTTLCVDSFLSVYSVFGGFPGLLQTLLDQELDLLALEAKATLAHFLFSEVAGRVEIPCGDVLAQLGRQGKKAGDLKLAEGRHKEVQQLIERGILKRVPTLSQLLLEDSPDFQYLQISDTVMAQAVASQTMTLMNKVTRLNKLRGFGLEYALADIAHSRLKSNQDLFGLPVKRWVVCDTWCGDGMDIDLLLVEETNDEPEDVFAFSPFDNDDDERDEKGEEQRENRMLVAATLKVQAASLKEVKHIEDFINSLRPFASSFSVVVALGCLLQPSEEEEVALLRLWREKCGSDMTVHSKVISLEAELNHAPVLPVSEILEIGKRGVWQVKREMLSLSLLASVAAHPIVRLQGHRQVGKTALVKTSLDDFTYFVLS